MYRLIHYIVEACFLPYSKLNFWPLDIHVSSLREAFKCFQNHWSAVVWCVLYVVFGLLCGVYVCMVHVHGVCVCVCVWGCWVWVVGCGLWDVVCVVWCGVVWCGVVWCGVVWCGVVWCGVVWCGVVWCGVCVYHPSSWMQGVTPTKQGLGFRHEKCRGPGRVGRGSWPTKTPLPSRVKTYLLYNSGPNCSPRPGVAVGCSWGYP